MRDDHRVDGHVNLFTDNCPESHDVLAWDGIDRYTHKRCSIFDMCSANFTLYRHKTVQAGKIAQSCKSFILIDVYFLNFNAQTTKIV